MPVPAARHEPRATAASPPTPASLAAMPDNPLHPMHRHLADRWATRPEPHIDRFALPVRAIVAVGSAALAWAGLIALARSVI